MTLVEALPELVAFVEGALVRIGRGDVADQLREVELERWTYDDFADVGYLYLRAPQEGHVVGETVSALDDVNLDLDDQRRLVRIELLGGRAIITQLEK